MTLLNTNYYSILFYNSEIWLLPSLSRPIKQNLLSASVAPLKMCWTTYHPLMSYERLQNISDRPTPTDYTKYSHEVLLHKIYNNQNQTMDWLDLNLKFQHQMWKANFFDTSKNIPGKNLLSNRLTVINNVIQYNWLNLPFKSFKNLSRKLFLFRDKWMPFGPNVGI